MNHYERLKVSQDAPPEVIRAAYRALAAKLHPDRQQQTATTGAGPDDATHAQMAALNQAYEVLIDPKLRLAYDATLAPSRPTVREPAGLDGAAPDMGTDAAGGMDMEWLAPRSAAPTGFWPPNRRTLMLGGGAVAVMALFIGSWLYKMEGQHSMERALSDQYVKPGEGAPNDAAGTTASNQPTDINAAERIIERDVAAAETSGKTARRRPSVEELSRMSDEELLKVLPTLDSKDDSTAPAPAPAPTGTAARRSGAAAPAPTRVASVRHPLDGKPLGLRTDMQLPEVAGKPNASKPAR